MANKEYIDKNRRWLEKKSREESSQPGIPGGSTLIFDIELLGVS